MNKNSIFEANGKHHWRIPLPARDAPYPHVLLHRRFQTLESYTAVWIDTEKFMACFARDIGYTIDPFEDWDDSEKEGFKNFMRPAEFEPPKKFPEWLRGYEPKETGSVEMPIAHAEINRVYDTSGILGFFGLSRKTIELPVVSFTNGRHRSRFLQAMGVKSFPVEVPVSQADLMRRICGVAEPAEALST